MKKRILSAVLSAVMVCMLIPSIPAGADSGVKIGDYMQLGTYYGEPILWRCVDIDENGPLMMADKVISFKPFDSRGNNTRAGGSSEDGLSSNSWKNSNIRSWLNSDEPAGKVTWACGNPPTAESIAVYGQVSEVYNAYADEAGFLTNFTDEEKAVIKSVSQKSVLAESDISDATEGSELLRFNSDRDEAMMNYDKAYAEYVTDKIFLPDLKQALAVYKNSDILGENYYIASATEQAFEHDTYEYKSRDNVYYFLRTPSTGYTSANYIVYSSGYLFELLSFNGRGGIRPAFYLDDTASLLGEGTEETPFNVETAKTEETKGDLLPLYIGSYAAYTNFTMQYIDYTNHSVAPMIVDDRTLVPVRYISEAFGAGVDWDGNTQSVSMTVGYSEINIKINQYYIVVNGQQQDIDVPAQIIEDRTMLSLRALAEALGKSVEYYNGLIVIGDKAAVDDMMNNDLDKYIDDKFEDYIVPEPKEDDVINTPYGDIYNYDYLCEHEVSYDLNGDGQMETFKTRRTTLFNVGMMGAGQYDFIVNGKAHFMMYMRHGHWDKLIITDIDKSDGYMDIIAIDYYKGIYGQMFQFDGTHFLPRKDSANLYYGNGEPTFCWVWDGWHNSGEREYPDFTFTTNESGTPGFTFKAGDETHSYIKEGNTYVEVK